MIITESAVSAESTLTLQFPAYAYPDNSTVIKNINKIVLSQVKRSILEKIMFVYE